MTAFSKLALIAAFAFVAATGMNRCARAADAVMILGTGHGVMILQGDPSGPVARTINVPPHDEDPAAVARWQEFCHPVEHVDSLGVTRLAYAHPGCEYGRDH